MKVSGFSFVRNAIKYDYPVVEAIQSILPLCDEVVVAVGNSDDGTRALVEQIDPKVRIIDTVWDESLREGGRVLAAETDKAFKAVSPDSDWCFYIQADEVLHEQYLGNVREAMIRYLDDRRVDGLLFYYRHFFGSYDYVGTSSLWYKREIRVIRNDRRIYSYRDAQGFRKNGNEKLNVKPVEAYIHHYGWVKHPRAMQLKQQSFQKLWHNDEWIEKHVAKADEFDYSGITTLCRYEGTHPAVMRERIARVNWKFDKDISRQKLSLKDRCKRWIEKITGWEIGYKNYRLI